MSEILDKESIEIEKNKEEIKNIISNIINKGSNYIIRAMPVNNHIKEILIDIKESLKEDEFKDIIKVAINSSINEGLEIVGIKKDSLFQIDKMVDVAFNGGLTKSINIGVDIVENMKKYGNIFYNYIEEFFESLKGYIAGKDFREKVYLKINRCLDKVEDFKDMCNDWYDAYDSFNLNSIKELADKLNKMKKKVSFDNNCVSENTIIQNVTELVSRENKKLTSLQFDICSNVEKI
ncbi:MAG: hypothetical protein ACI4ON_01815 [Clostridia bacterium]